MAVTVIVTAAADFYTNTVLCGLRGQLCSAHVVGLCDYCSLLFAAFLPTHPNKLLHVFFVLVSILRISAPQPSPFVRHVYIRGYMYTYDSQQTVRLVKSRIKGVYHVI